MSYKEIDCPKCVVLRLQMLDLFERFTARGKRIDELLIERSVLRKVYDALMVDRISRIQTDAEENDASES